MPHVLLASTSPRRQHLLSLLGVEHEVQSSDFDEYAVQLDDFASREEYVSAIAAGKVLALTDRFPQTVILGGDLSTFVGDTTFHKPKDFTQAREFFLAFTNTWHDEIAATAVWSPEKGLTLAWRMTRIFTPVFSEQELDAYLATAHPLDKSGGYNLIAVSRVLRQNGRGDELILEGEVSAVLGFPLADVSQELEKHGVHVPVDVRRLEEEIHEQTLQDNPGQSGQAEATQRKMKL